MCLENLQMDGSTFDVQYDDDDDDDEEVSEEHQ